MKRLEIFSVLSAEASSKWIYADHSGYQGANVKDDFVRSTGNSMKQGWAWANDPPLALSPFFSCWLHRNTILPCSCAFLPES